MTQGRSWIIESAFAMLAAAGRFAERARWFFYQVTLSNHVCPACSGTLIMTGESRCRCETCSREIDPTVTFQRCVDCGGRPSIAVRRYRCRACGADIPSRFLFDGLAFDTEYFRQKMAESRQRKHQLRERVRNMLAAS